MPKKLRRATQQEILTAYDRDAQVYAGFAQALKELIGNILQANDIPIHSVSCRLKSRASLAAKLTKPGATYETLEDVTDVCGVRIITYFEDTVDHIAALLEEEFTIDLVNSIDKRSTLDPDRFGYLSLHHVMELKPQRTGLIEYRRFGGRKAEVQTRSMQHAWAEIEHDLGYKSRLDVPRELRRRFARLAGLLELADEEFTSIRNALRTYVAEVPGRIADAPQLVELDKASIAAFVDQSDVVGALDRKIAELVGAEIYFDSADFFEDDAPMLARAGVATAQELDAALRKNGAVLVEFAREWLDPDHTHLHMGISLFYLWCVLAAQTLAAPEIRAILEEYNVGSPDERDELVKDIKTTYEGALKRAGA